MGSAMTNDLRRFEALVAEAFSFLGTFGFERGPLTVTPPECRIVFVNDTSEVVVAFELGTGPWIEVGKRTGPGRPRERYDLQFLLQERAPNEASKVLLRDLDDAVLEAELQRLATLAQRHATDLLTGDFKVLPRLRARAEENLARTNAELYGHKKF
jgi:hypothetical protein